MFVSAMDGAKKDLSALRSNLLFNHSLRGLLTTEPGSLPNNFPESPPYDEWKKLDHAVAVSRLYQIYESFVHECVTEWLDTISKLIPYEDLPDKTRSTHRDGIGFILQNLDGRRFSSMSLQTLIREYNDAISGSPVYRLHADAFLLHDRNLKIEQLQTVASSCGLELSISEWIKNHRLTAKHDAYQLIGVPSAEKAISSLVDLRNESAHATRQITEICGEDVLIAYVDFIYSLVEALIEGFCSRAILEHEKHGAWSLVGKINFVKREDKTVCVAPLECCTVRTGAVVYLMGKYHCTRATIQELQVCGKNVSSQTIAINREEVGFKFDVVANKSSAVYLEAISPVQQLSLPTLIESSIDLKDAEVGEIEQEEPDLDKENAES